MNRGIWTGVVAGVLAALVLLAVGFTGYQAGRDDEVVTRVVDGDVVRVVEDGWLRHGPGHGPGFGFFLFVFLAILAVAFVARRAGRGGWHRPGPYGPRGFGAYGGGPGGGWYGPGGRGAYGPGAGPEEVFDDWHRRSHERAESPPVSEPGAQPGPAPTPGTEEPNDAPPAAGTTGAQPAAAPGDG